MENREVPRLGRSLSVVGMGCWQIGASWGEVSDTDATATVAAALEAGVTFLDTADVYGDGRSEQLIAETLAGTSLMGRDDVLVATKAGRRADPHVPEAYTADALRAWTDRSRQNLSVDTLDLVQLHCPPTEVYSDDAVFDALDGLVEAGSIAAYGVSVETCDQALAAIARPNVASVQIIFNAFRLKPLEQVLPAAAEAGAGIIARVPLASGLLTGRYDASTTFSEDDHRNFNRDGSKFDVGETFAGVPFETGLTAVSELKEIAGDRPLAEVALRFVIDSPGLTSVIPGARNPDQARRNAAVADTEPLTDGQRADITAVYDRHIRPLVHSRW